jgi:hypothetical protein
MVSMRSSVFDYGVCPALGKLAIATGVAGVAAVDEHV